MPARFDSARLRPVDPAAVATRDSAHAQALVDACRLGAGPGTRPLGMPWLPPRTEWPFGVLQVADGAAARQAALQLDGSWWMQDAGGALGRLAVRAGALLREACWWRPLGPRHAWDSGEATDPTALGGFTPRRPTLVLLQGPLNEAACRALAELDGRSAGFRHAVRVVIVDAGPAPGFARPLGF